LKIWQLDPANLTPYYDMALAKALAEAGQSIRFISSRYLYENLEYPKNYRFDEVYFRGLDHPLIRKNKLLRQILRGLSYPLGHWQLLQSAKHERPDILHIQWSRLPIFDNWLISEMKKLSVPIVHTVHDVIPLFSRMDNSGLGKVYAAADALIVHSEANAKALLEAFPMILPEKVHRIPMIAFPDPDNLPMPKNASQAEARRLLSIAPDAPMVLFFGAMKPYKGVDILAEAIERLDDSVEFWLVGAPDAEAEIVLSRLAKRKNVHIVADYIPAQELWRYHMAADLVVFPYRHIFQSAALITALAYGKAVMVSDVGGMPETIDGNGWIVPAEDSAALSAALKEAVSNREQWAAMGQRSREIILQDYSPAAVAAKHIELYQRLAAT
jgi:glycosyltransferase involved in cell wall biosynthesis